MSPRTWLAALATALAIPAFASSASALTMTFGGSDDPSLHGTSGALSIDGPIDAGTGTFDVVWSMDFAGYQGSSSNHPYLTQIAFKAFKDITFISLDEVIWTAATGGTPLFPSNVNNGGCVTGRGSQAGMVCLDLDPDVNATMGGQISAYFTVTGDLDMSEWSYRGKFGPANGWVISESGSPIPEPTAAMLFAVGLAVARMRLRRA